MARISMRERNQVTVGIIGLAVAVLLVTVSLNISAVRAILGEETFTAQLSDAGGARSGDDVRVDGITVGSIKSVELEGTSVEVEFGASDVRLGDETRVEVRSENALGSKYLAVEPAGAGSQTTIPVERTSPGYAVSEVLGELTNNNEEIDEEQLARSFESVTQVLEATPEEFDSALEGVSSLSKTVSKRDAELDELLERASSVSEVLADRNREVVSIFTAGSSVFQRIQDQRARLEVLFSEVGQAAEQINLLVEENKKTIGPKLREITRLSTTLNDYRDELAYILQTFPKYARSLGEAVGSGPFFHAYIPNVLAPETLVNPGDILNQLITNDTSDYFPILGGN